MVIILPCGGGMGEEGGLKEGELLQTQTKNSRN